METRPRGKRAPPSQRRDGVPRRTRHPGSILQRHRHRVRPAEAGNRGYSYPSGGRVRALQTILRPRIPPNRPQNAENRRESGFPGSTRANPNGHPAGRRLAYGRILPPPVTTKLPAGRSIEDHVGRIVGHDGAALGRGDGVRGVEHAAAHRSCGGAETGGSKGGVSAPLPRCRVQHGVGWLDHRSVAQARPRRTRSKGPTKTTPGRSSEAGSGSAETRTGRTAYRWKAPSSRDRCRWSAGQSPFADAPGTRAYAAPRCENDAGGRFTNRRSGDSRGAFRPSACAVVSCGLAARPPAAGLAAPAVAGATPQSEALVRVRGRVCFHTLAPAPWVAPEPAIRAGRRFSAPSRRGRTSVGGSGPGPPKPRSAASGNNPQNGNTELKHRETPVVVPRLGRRGNGPPARGRGGGAGARGPEQG